MRELKGKRRYRALRQEAGRCYCVAAAVIGSAVVSAGVGAVSSANAASSASATADRQMAQNAQVQAQQNAIQQQQVDLSKRNQDMAEDYNNYNKTVYRPLETGLVNEATNAGSINEQDIAAGKASAGVQHAFTQSREASGRNLARMGISANSGRALAVNANLDANAALGSAAAANTARDGAKQLGWAKRMDAASLGRNLPSAQAASASLANQGLAGAATNGIGTANVLTMGNNASLAASGMRGDAMMGVAQVGAGISGMAMRYGTGTTGPVSQGYFSGNSSDPLSNSNASEFNRIAQPDNYG